MYSVVEERESHRNDDNFEVNLHWNGIEQDVEVESLVKL